MFAEIKLTVVNVADRDTWHCRIVRAFLVEEQKIVKKVTWLCSLDTPIWGFFLHWERRLSD